MSWFKVFLDFLKTNKWMHLFYILSLIGFFGWLVLKDQSCSYSDKKRTIKYDSKSKINLEYKK